jgi:hypothetical protein
MKTLRITIILFSLLVIYSCHNQHGRKAEGDTPVVRKLNSEKFIIKKPDKTEQKELESCESLVKEILTCSPRYRQLTKGLNEAVVKNGGLSFEMILEGSPKPKPDKAWRYSKTYDFTVYEMYTDRALNTASFSFNPENKLLYEYDATHNQLKSIAFDRNLLLKFESLCK